MHAIYSFASGPMVWIAFFVFCTGSLYRLVSMALLAKKRDGAVYAYMEGRFALRSILHWITPFASHNMREKPMMTLAAFGFHLGIFLVPLFLFAHIVLLKESFNLSWWYLPDPAADVLTVVVILCCVYFLQRRILRPEVRYLTTVSDYLILAGVATPFVTGFWAAQQWPGYSWVLIAHMLSGEVMLMMIPFTRLAHMIFFPVTRGYMGSEFGGVRHAQDW